MLTSTWVDPLWREHQVKQVWQWNLWGDETCCLTQSTQKVAKRSVPLWASKSQNSTNVIKCDKCGSLTTHSLTQTFTLPPTNPHTFIPPSPHTQTHTHKNTHTQKTQRYTHTHTHKDWKQQTERERERERERENKANYSDNSQFTGDKTQFVSLEQSQQRRQSVLFCQSGVAAKAHIHSSKSALVVAHALDREVVQWLGPGSVCERSSGPT